MRISPKSLLHGLLYTTPVLLLVLASCGGGGGGGGSTPAATVTPPAAPTNASAIDDSACNARVKISWNYATGATGYNLYRSQTSSVLVTSTNKINAISVTTSPYIDTAVSGVTPATTYYYKVTAVNSGGESAGSNETHAAPSPGTGCTAIGGSIQGNALTLTPTVSTLAGKDGIGGSTDAIGTTATFKGPHGITTDGKFLYIADTSNNLIRKIDLSTAEVTTIAGIAGVSGTTDTTSSTSATFNGPEGITATTTDLYVADTGSHTIRQIAIASPYTVTTIAGIAGASGVTDSPTGTSAKFNLPSGITTDGTSLYVADTANHTIRLITIGGTYGVTTIAGIAGASGIADNGIGTSATFNFPRGITATMTDLYVADTGSHTIRQITIGGTYGVTTIAGIAGASGVTDSSTGASAKFNLPSGITTDGTSLYVADTANHTIRQIATTSPYGVTTVAGTAGSCGSTNGTSALFCFSVGITTDGTFLYDADNGKNTIRKIQ